MEKGYVYTQGDIIIEPFVFTKILDLKIVQEINEHSKLYISGIVSDEYDYSDKYVETCTENTRIKVSLKDDKENITDVFYGVITDISLDSFNDVKTLNIEALSYTYLMDIEKKCRSFQCDTLTYEEILKEVNDSYSSMCMIDNTTNGQTIDKLLVQYNETDWQFVKRICSHFNTAAIAYCRLEGIRYSIGKLGSDYLHSLDEFNYCVKMGLKDYRKKSKSISNFDFNAINFVSYEIKTSIILDLYNPIEFRNKYFYVYKCETYIENRVIVNKYILRSDKDMLLRKNYNEKLAGISLEGKILDTKSDVVKVNLEIDGYSNRTDNTEWIPYSTVFSSPDGTGWYCMPEVGDAIRIYFPDADEKNSYAISSVNLESTDNEKRCDPSVKSLGTKYGKEIVMKPGAIDIISSSNTMSLDDGGGINISSSSQIYMNAPDITLDGGKISIRGKDEVEIKQGGASILVKDDVTMSGGKINTQ
ncbi:phage tail protein [Clostridium butyricum]|uniref:phage tail protein n=1 Tax=Clostridium butyricum TaxID=1492 RepID=UPI0013D08A83|nr:phage tail protein [Clostridium butyricum]MCQ2017866.1 phage tail protein [Clostridium butyricum]MCQ2022555.1 phage tail protein [Clostridium butyricum]NFB71597.1 phage tail protein [Clostridium butyricum]NFB92944.1 phage tail protein [Clostridium butyricum]UTY55110.1 phage tail protein [Clostridium butyricum]